MIDKRDVQVFFDRLAPDWDAGMVRNEAVIARILDNAGVCEGCTVLDVACGTGVLFGDYVKRGAARVTAVDLSPEMAARKRPPGRRSRWYAAMWRTAPPRGTADPMTW